MTTGALGIRFSLPQQLHSGDVQLALRSHVLCVHQDSATAHNLVAEPDTDAASQTGRAAAR